LSGFPRPELLASTDWLGEHLDRPEIRIIDARWRPDGSGAAAFETGHLPGAAHVNWQSGLSETSGGEEGPRLRLGTPTKVGAALRGAGVGDGATVVIYDDALGLHAARVWWSLLAYGVKSGRILNGGFPAWQQEARPVTAVSVPPPSVRFTPRLEPRVRLDASEVRALLGSPDVLILDARAEPEYRGFQGNARQLGHIPGAVNLPVGAMHDPGSQRLRGAEVLRAQLDRAGIGKGRRIVCYDSSGLAAAKLAFVLSLFGHEDVAVYDGGWSEWGDRSDLPVER